MTSHDITSRILLWLEHLMWCHVKVRRYCNKINFNYYLQYISVTYWLATMKLLALMYYDGPGGRCNYSSKGSSPGSQHTRGGHTRLIEMKTWPVNPTISVDRRCCGLWKCGRGGVLHSECSIYHVYNLAFLHVYIIYIYTLLLYLILR